MKNNKLINFFKNIGVKNKQQNEEFTTKSLLYIYAALAITLYDRLDLPDEEKQDTIESIFADSQKIWEGLGDKDILDLCEEKTGIELRRSE